MLNGTAWWIEQPVAKTEGQLNYSKMTLGRTARRWFICDTNPSFLLLLIFVARKHFIAIVHSHFAIERSTFCSIVGWVSFIFLPGCYHKFSHASQLVCWQFGLFNVVIWDEQGKPKVTVQRKVKKIMHSSYLWQIISIPQQNIAKSRYQLYIKHLFSFWTICPVKNTTQIAQEISKTWQTAVWLTFAPASMRARAQATWSPTQASWSGVTWSMVRTFTLWPLKQPQIILHRTLRVPSYSHVRLSVSVHLMTSWRVNFLYLSETIAAKQIMSWCWKSEKMFLFVFLTLTRV